jgi:hypothetical protein
VPIGEEEAWDRQRAAIVPVTIVFAFFYLNGNMSTEGSEFENKYFLISLIWMIPGGFVGLMIKLKTKLTEAPEWLMTVFSILCFIMSIMWIQFTCNIIIDLL